MSLEKFGGIDLGQIFGFRASSFIQSFYIWQPLTYAFLHGGTFHLLFNLLVFYMMAGDLEAFWGPRSFYKFCAATAVAGPLLQVLLWIGAYLINPEWINSELFIRPTIGASGMVFGILAAYGMLYGEASILVFFVVPMKMRVFVISLAVYEMGMGLFSASGEVAHIFHLGGMLAGYLMIKYKGPGLRGGGGGGGFRLFGKSKMNQQELRKRLKVISNELPKKNENGDRGLPITWN